MSQLCTRCGQRDALRSNMVIGFTHGAFCSDCAAAIVRDLMAQAGEPQLPPGFTAEQIVDGLQQFSGAAEEAGPDASREDLLKALKRRMGKGGGAA